MGLARLRVHSAADADAGCERRFDCRPAIRACSGGGGEERSLRLRNWAIARRGRGRGRASARLSSARPGGFEGGGVRCAIYRIAGGDAAQWRGVAKLLGRRYC